MGQGLGDSRLKLLVVPMESSGQHLIPPAMVCDNTHGTLSTGKLT